jgi:hypothetical protein
MIHKNSYQELSISLFAPIGNFRKTGNRTEPLVASYFFEIHERFFMAYLLSSHEMNGRMTKSTQ